MRVYISGPITGHEDTYEAAFAAAATRLRTSGYEPINPADLGIRDDWTWDDYMVAAIDMQRTCQGIYMLPGWRSSRGAVVEYYVAQALGQRVWGSPR